MKELEKTETKRMEVIISNDKTNIDAHLKGGTTID